MSRSQQMNTSAFLKHFHSLRNSYKMIVCLNLLASNKQQEQALTTEFEALVQLHQSNMPFLKYDYFDYHQQVKASRESLNSLVSKLQTLIQKAFKFYAQKSGQVISQQKGVIRVNCLDCLDRTNVVMGKIGLVVFDLIMRYMGINLQSYANISDILSFADASQPGTTGIDRFIQDFKELWADNGDYLSIQYSGTGSSLTGQTKGKSALMGMLDQMNKGIGRFYIGNFEDQIKQCAID